MDVKKTLAMALLSGRFSVGRGAGRLEIMIARVMLVAIDLMLAGERKTFFLVDFYGFDGVYSAAYVSNFR